MAPAAAGDVYLGSSDTPVQRRFHRRLLAFTGIGVGAYCLTLLATIPAQLVSPLPDATGTAWHGSAPLDGGNRLDWHWAPLGSIARFGFAADWTITGSQSALAGRALLRPGSLRLDSVSGSADGALLRLAGSPGFTCTLRLQVDIQRLAIGGGAQGGDGRITSDPGSCQASGATASVPVPALGLDLRQTPGLAVINLAPLGRRRAPYLVGGLTEAGKLDLIVTADGAQAFPFASPPGGMKIATEL